MKTKFIDLTGQKFGHWTVLKRVPPETVKTMYPQNKGQAMFYCKCKCGEISIVLGTNLRKGLSHSCMSCAAYDRYNGGNPWSGEARRRRIERTEKAAER